MRGGGNQQERRIAYRLLHRGGFFFGVFGFIQNDDFAARYPQTLGNSGPGFRRADWIRFAAAPVKMSFEPGFSYHRRIPPSAAAGCC